MYSLLPNFSHIYVEDDAVEYEDTRSILARFPEATVVKIGNYKEVFNRSRQDWRKQKSANKLILAVKRDGFLYEGSNVAPDFGYEHFYYNSLVLNCLYDCHYCYLQGMYPSANVVMFVNNEDYLEATSDLLKEKSPIYLCISYDTDLLAFEGLLPYCRRWILYTTQNPNLTIELRTKSANYKAISDLKPVSNVVLAWTLSPELVAKKYETKTPSLKSRLKALRQAVNDGWRVRLCFDPVLAIPEWSSIYKDFIGEVAEAVPLDRIADITIGDFRMNKEYFKRTKATRPESDILHREFESTGGLVMYDQQTRSAIRSEMESTLLSLGYQEDRIVYVDINQ